MAKFLADEVLEVGIGETKVLTAAMIDQVGRSRAQGALLVSHDRGGDSTCALRFVTDPDTVAFKYLPLATGAAVRIDTYENLRDLKIKNIGNTPATLFLQVFN